MVSFIPVSLSPPFHLITVQFTARYQKIIIMQIILEKKFCPFSWSVNGKYFDGKLLKEDETGTGGRGRTELRNGRGCHLYRDGDAFGTGCPRFGRNGGVGVNSGGNALGTSDISPIAKCIHKQKLGTSPSCVVTN